MQKMDQKQNDKQNNSESHEYNSTNYRKDKDKDDPEFKEIQIMINDYLSENN